MGDYFKPLVPGDPVTKMSRTAYNLMLEMLKWWKTAGGGRGLPSSMVDRDQSVFSCRNDSGEDIDEYGVVGIDGPLITPADNEREFLSKTPLSGVLPTVADHLGQWGVFLGAIPDGQIGKVCVSGVVPVRVYVSDPADKYCDVIEEETVGDETVRIGTGSSGQRLEWLDPDVEAGDIAWALVRLGTPNHDVRYSQLVRVKNCTEEDWGPLEIVGALLPDKVEFSTPVPYQDDANLWDKTTVFRAYRLNHSFGTYAEWAAYGSYLHGMTLGITQQPIDAGKIGLVCIRGVTPALCLPDYTGYSYCFQPWAQVYKTASGRWTLRGGMAGDARILNVLSEDETDGQVVYNEDGDLLVLVDLCDVPNRQPVCNPSESVTVPAFSTGRIAGTVFSPYPTETATRYSCWNKEASGEVAAASPGWAMPPLSLGWAYRITEATPVCVQTHVDPNTYSREHQLSWGPIGGSYHAWPGLPGFEIVGAMPDGTYTVNGEYFAWVKRNLNQPILVKADGAQRGPSGYTVNGCWCTDGNGSSPAVYDGGSLPLVKALLAIPQGEEFNPATGYLAYWGPVDNKTKEVNVQDGQLIRVRAGVAEGAWYAGAEVLDDPVGTVKLWIGDIDSIPAGWREYAAMQERFPAGIKEDSTWVAEVGDTGGDVEHTHPTGSAAGGGSAEDAGEAANHLPPYSGVIFIERYQ